MNSINYVNIELNLSRRNRKTLLRLSKQLFPAFRSIKIRKRTVHLRRRWYSLGQERMQVVDLVFLHIPQAINDLYEEHDQSPVFDYANDLGSAVEYFGFSIMGKDMIQFLQYHVDNLNMSITLNNYLDPIPVELTEQESIEVKETYATKHVLDESITYFYNLMTSVIGTLRSKLKVVYVSTESACNSPPIRGPSIALSA